MKMFRKTLSIVKKYTLVFLCMGIINSITIPAMAAQVKVAWDPASDSRVVGYKLYYGTTSRSYANAVNPGNTTNYTLTGLAEGQVYYIALTSYDSQGNESTYSTELVVNIPKVDTDSDGLSDSDEINIYKTDPLKADTDGDTIIDGVEVAQGTDPITPNNVQKINLVAGSASFGNNPVTVYLNSSLAKPVVIAGVPSYKGSDPGIVSINNVSASSFSVRFQEWSYLDGSHSKEKASYIVIGEGRYTPQDGSFWEAKTFTLNGTAQWNKINFSAPFPGTPKIFLTIQTTSDPTPVLVRVRNVNAENFEVAFFHEEAKKNVTHGTEIVGYLAVWAPNDSGSIDNTPYVTGNAMVSSSWANAGTFSLMLQEEKSADKETTHSGELVDILVFGPNVFAQNVWWLDQDPASLRMK